MRRYVLMGPQESGVSLPLNSSSLAPQRVGWRVPGWALEQVLRWRRGRSRDSGSSLLHSYGQNVATIVPVPALIGFVA